MRTTMRALAAVAALCCLGAATPASAQTRPARAAQPAAQAPGPSGPAAVPVAPDDAGAEEGDDRGGAGYLPGAQFQRKLDGGPGFVCTATNALHTDQCTASCRKGETADCVDADGSGAPSCGCTKG